MRQGKTSVILKRRTGSGLMFVAMLVGCSPQTQPATTTAISDNTSLEKQTEPKLSESQPSAVTFEQASSDESASNSLPDTQPEPTDTIATDEDTETDVQKFIGQDGRERVVPTGPPPTDQDGRLELTFDDLSFEMEKGSKFDRSMLTDRINQFHSKEVRLRGFIRPSFRQSKIEKFVFVRDDKECCFGPGAAIYDNALVSLKKGTQTNYTVRPVVVTGQLFLKEYETPDGMVLSIYRIRNGKIE